MKLAKLVALIGVYIPPRLGQPTYGEHHYALYRPDVDRTWLAR